MSLGQALKRISTAEKLLISRSIEEWLVLHPEGVMITDEMPDDLAAVALRLLSDTSNSQRVARFGASSRGTCLRYQIFRFLGMPGLKSYDPVLQNLFNDGTFRHIRWQLMGLMAGVLTDVETKFTIPKYHVGVSCDGVNDDQEFMFELKGMAFFSKVINEGPSPAHQLQIDTCLMATGYELCSYVVEDKKTQDWVEIVIRADRSRFAVVKQELEALTYSVEEKKLPNVLPDCRAKKGAIWQGCPYRKQCPGCRTWPEGGRWGSPVQAPQRKRRKKL